MARLYADEDQSRRFVVLARQRGHEVAYAAESAASRTDAWHLREASDGGRILVTFNHRDYQFLHRLWTSLRILEVIRNRHAGIVTATDQRQLREAGTWLDAIGRLLVEDAELTGRMLVWHPSRQEWREDAWRPED